MEKTVSVVVTCYNHDAYIEDCLRSIFNQTYRNISLFVYNDGSTDNSEAVIQSLLEESPYSETHYVYHANQGLVKTRNKALDNVKADYLLFVDSDNALEHNYIEAMLSVAEQENADIVYPIIKNLETQELILEAKPFDLERLYVENYMESCSLMRRSIIADERYDTNLNYKKLEDYEFFCNLIVRRHAKAVPCLTTHLNYRVLDNSMSARDDIRYYYEVYSYILGKYFQDNPVFAKKALQANFLKLHDAMLPVDYQLSVYYDRRQGFSISDKTSWELATQDELTLMVADDVESLRIDLGELPCYFKTVSLCDAHGQVLVPEVVNGFRDGDSYFFTKRDPQLIYRLDNKGQQYRLRYEMFHLYSHHETNLVNQQLVEQSAMLLSRISECEKEVTDYQATRALLEDTQRQLDDLRMQYGAVISSRRWIIPTKLINFFRRNE